jgi:uncharacterized RDD family membrane protein YckC
MLLVMNATAQASSASISGPTLDNRRVMAALVDLAIVVAGSLVILFAADALSGDRGGALGAVILGWALYYYFALESGDGQTVGKKLLKLRVVRADGRPAEMRDVAVRTVLRVVDGIGGYIVGLIVMLATGQRRQRLGDLAAGTIVVDASAPSFAPPAPVSAPLEEAQVEELVEDDPTQGIVLPPRPAPPATLADLAAPEAPAAPEMRPFDPPVGEDEPVEDEPVADEVVEDEPVEDEPVAPLVAVEDEPVVLLAAVEDEPAEDDPVEDEPAEDDPVADEPVLTLAEPVDDAADEPLADDSLADASSTSLEELARDVVAAQSEPVPVVELAAPLEDEPVEDEPFTLKSVETVSAIDLVMGGASEEDPSDDDHEPEPPAAS